MIKTGTFLAMRKAESSIGLFAFLLIALPALAHLEHGPQDSKPLTCYSIAARSAWGAYSQGVGAPPVFRYVEYGPLRQLFSGLRKDMPTDGIYVLEAMNEDERAEYQKAALEGWNWAKANQSGLEMEWYTAKFMDMLCRGNP